SGIPAVNQVSLLIPFSSDIWAEFVGKWVFLVLDFTLSDYFVSSTLPEFGPKAYFFTRFIFSGYGHLPIFIKMIEITLFQIVFHRDNFFYFLFGTVVIGDP